MSKRTKTFDGETHSAEPHRDSMTDAPYKYNEVEIVREFQRYLLGTYGEHYQTENADDNLQCFDVWIAKGNSVSSFRDTAMKYLWRYGSKGGNNKADLLKAMHYILLMVHVDHYRKNGARTSEPDSK